MTPPRPDRSNRHEAGTVGSTRTSVAALVPAAVLAMVVLAGCTGTISDLPGGAPAPYTQTGAALNGTALAADTLAGLRDAGSFRANTTMRLDASAISVQVDRTAAVDLAANRSSSRSQIATSATNGSGITMDRYSTANATYRRMTLDLGRQTITRYDVSRAPYDDGPLAPRPVTASRMASADLVRASVDRLNWTQAGVEKYDGGWVTRYEATGVANVTGLSRAAMEDAVESANETALSSPSGEGSVAVNATLLVSPDGVVRRLEVRVSGQSERGESYGMTLRVTTTDLGSTQVEPPAWLAEARAQTA